MAPHALGVRAVERHPGEELGGHAPTLAGVVAPATGARSGGGWLAQLVEEGAVPPHRGEPAGFAHRAGTELLVDDERTGVDIADRVDQADDATGAAQVEPRQWRAEGVEVEEAVAGEDLVTVGEQPAVDRALLVLGRVEVVPRVGAAARRPQSGDAQLGAVTVGERFQVVELVDVVAGDDDGDLERAEARGGEMVHRRPGPGVGAVAADGVVGRCIDAVEAHLDVEVVHPRQAIGGPPIDERPVGRELDADAVPRRVVDELEEVAADHRLAAADVDVEDLQGTELVEHGDRLSSRQLVRVAPARRREAVDARQVAGVGQLPGQADRGVEAGLELLGERDRGETPRPFERQPPGVVAIGECSEPLRPPAEEVIAQRSVHPAHAIDRDLLDDQLVLDQLVALGDDPVRQDRGSRRSGVIVRTLLRGDPSARGQRASQQPIR